jgi:phosphate transport system substrate-binding protein
MRHRAVCLTTLLAILLVTSLCSAQAGSSESRSGSGAEQSVEGAEVKGPEAQGPEAQAKRKRSLVDPSIQPYRKVTNVSGSLNAIGSDTLNNLMTFWAEGFRKLYPNVKIQIEGKGSATAPPALLAGTADMGPMSRSMRKSEIDAFKRKYGYPPLQIAVAIDALAVYVHKDNPIESLSLRQLDAIFSKQRRGGLERALTQWGQLELGDAWDGKAIRLYGRNSASGTYAYFKNVALFDGDYKNTVKAQPGSSAVVSSVAKDIHGIGYSGVGYRTSGVRVVPLSKGEGQAYSATSAPDVYAGRYPLSRFLYIYVNQAPGKPLPPRLIEFLRFVLSREGQQLVEADGYLPMTARLRQRSLRKLGL